MSSQGRKFEKMVDVKAIRRQAKEEYLVVWENQEGYRRQNWENLAHLKDFMLDLAFYKKEAIEAGKLTYTSGLDRERELNKEIMIDQASYESFESFESQPQTLESERESDFDGMKLVSVRRLNEFLEEQHYEAEFVMTLDRRIETFVLTYDQLKANCGEEFLKLRNGGER